MAVLSRDEYFARLHSHLGEDSSEESITFLEDMTDTYNDMASRGTGDGVDWEQKYHDLDESWKRRYVHRFLTGGDSCVPNEIVTAEGGNEYNPNTIQTADLFN